MRVGQIAPRSLPFAQCLRLRPAALPGLAGAWRKLLTSWLLGHLLSVSGARSVCPRGLVCVHTAGVQLSTFPRAV